MTCLIISRFALVVVAASTLVTVDAANLNRDMGWRVLDRKGYHVDKLPMKRISSHESKQNIRYRNRESNTRLIQEDALFYEIFISSMSIETPSSYAPVASPNLIPKSKQPVSPMFPTTAPKTLAPVMKNPVSPIDPKPTITVPTTPAPVVKTPVSPTVPKPTIKVPTTLAPVRKTPASPTVAKPTIVPSNKPNVVKTKAPLRVPVPTTNTKPVVQPSPIMTTSPPVSHYSLIPSEAHPSLIPTLLVSQFPIRWSDPPSNLNTIMPESDLPTVSESLLTVSPTDLNLSGMEGQSIFFCSENGVLVVPSPNLNNINTTKIDLSVSYSVDTTSPLESYKADLERKIVGVALAGALQCPLGGPIFENPNVTEPINVTVVTFVNGERCTPQVNTSRCQVQETDARLYVSGTYDSQIVAFLAYKKLQEQMGGSSFLFGLPAIEHIEYLRPLTDVPPQIESNGKDNMVGGKSGTVSANPWTLGAVVAMCTGGLIALWAWVRNRRTRNRRHMQLIEDI